MVFRNGRKIFESENNSIAQQRKASLIGDTDVPAVTLRKYILHADSGRDALIRILSCEDLNVACHALLYIREKIA